MEDKVLIVDDDDLFLACFQRMLSRHFALDTASGPSEALHAISTKGPYAVIVSDMRMPGMKGQELLTKAKELMPDTIGILLSGNVEDTEAEARYSKFFRVVAK